MEAQGFVSKKDQVEKADRKADMSRAQGSGGPRAGFGNMIQYTINSRVVNPFTLTLDDQSAA
jgi:hypothetical protein